MAWEEGQFGWNLSVFLLSYNGCALLHQTSHATNHTLNTHHYHVDENKRYKNSVLSKKYDLIKQVNY